MKKRKYGNYEAYLIESLKDPKEALAYLNATLMDEDPQVFLLALEQVRAARGITKTELARETGLNRENLYRMFSVTGNPKLTNLKSVLNNLGLELAIQPYNQSRKK